jgi:ABC-type branched-subunit amino acid transport system substrate-binding protein
MLKRSCFVVALASLFVLLAGGATASARLSAPSLTATSAVVVSPGQPVQIAFVGSSDFPTLTHDFRNGIQMAIEQHPMIRGHSIQVNEFDPPCFSGPDPAAANVLAATAIVSNAQNTGVIGHICSQGLAPALPTYEGADLVTISGSATAPLLPSLAPDVFNRTIVEDPDSAAWYALVMALPSDLAFQQDYQSEFGAAPSIFTDLYFDAASLLLRRLQQVSTIVERDLVVDRAALASAVRDTTKFQGVTCAVTLDPSTGNRVDDPAALARCADG